VSSKLSKMWKTGSSRTRLRQIALVAKDIEKTKDLLVRPRVLLERQR
jgi:hypothetical protein